MARLRDIMPLIVHPSQTCSVPGRSIFSSLATRIGLKVLFVRLYEVKAFDLVEHDYLFAVLGAFGFPLSFMGLLREVYSGLSSALTVGRRQRLL